jgi:hypothetical protein
MHLPGALISSPWTAKYARSHQHSVGSSVRGFVLHPGWVGLLIGYEIDTQQCLVLCNSRLVWITTYGVEVAA